MPSYLYTYELPEAHLFKGRAKKKIQLILVVHVFPVNALRIGSQEVPSVKSFTQMFFAIF